MGQGKVPNSLPFLVTLLWAMPTLSVALGPHAAKRTISRQAWRKAIFINESTYAANLWNSAPNPDRL